MFVIQANIGDDYNQNQIDISSNDYIVFSNGYNSASSSNTGIKRILDLFTEIDTVYAKKAHLMRDTSIYEINYSGESLYAAQSLFYADPDSSTNFDKFSFRIIFIDNIIDWVRTPKCYTKIPTFFYGYSSIDTLITPFFYTSTSGIGANDIIELDGNKCMVTSVETVSSSYYKIYITPYDSSSSFIISKEKYVIRDYNLPLTDTNYVNMIKVLFHDDYISLDQIPSFDETTDITDSSNRTFRTTYEQANLDISNTSFYIDLSSYLDLTLQMLISDFSITSSINVGDTVIYFTTSIFSNLKKGDYILIRNDVYSEIMRINSINTSNYSVSVTRPYTKYAFLTSDSSIKCYRNRIVLFQTVVMNSGEYTVNYPIQFNMEIKYLNI